MTRTNPILNAHAGGLWQGTPYTNCREAYVRSYRLGARSFEIDISISKDGKFVASHDFWGVADMSEREFLANRPRYGLLRKKGTLMNLSDIAELSNEFPGLRLMFDFHGSLDVLDRQFRERDFSYDIKSALKKFFECLASLNILNKSIVECYSYTHVLDAESIGATRLQLWIDVEDERLPALNTIDDYVRFCATHHVVAVSLPGKWLRENQGKCVVKKFHNAGLLVYSSGWEDAEDRVVAEEMQIDFITVDRICPLKGVNKCLSKVTEYCKFQLFGTGSGLRTFVRQAVPGANKLFQIMRNR